MKSPSHPEFTFRTKSGMVSAMPLAIIHPATMSCFPGFLPLTGVMSVKLHPRQANLLAVGCYDGSVVVFDARGGPQPKLRSSGRSGGHLQPVWAVAWQNEEPGTHLGFHSLASDGRLLLWTLGDTELTCQVTCPVLASMPGGRVTCFECCIACCIASCIKSVIIHEEGFRPPQASQ